MTIATTDSWHTHEMYDSSNRKKPYSLPYNVQYRLIIRSNSVCCYRKINKAVICPRFCFGSNDVKRRLSLSVCKIIAKCTTILALHCMQERMLQRSLSEMSLVQ